MKNVRTIPAHVTLSFNGRSRTRRYEDLTIADNFMFHKVMQDREMCRRLLQILLGLSPEVDITDPVAEGGIRTSPDSKSVFLDIRTSTPFTEYDIEMQRAGSREIPRRARYYQSVMDIDFLDPSMNYIELKENVVLFICLTDIFGRGLPVYTFSNTCSEAPGLPLNDGTKKVFYIAENYDKISEEEARSFMALVKTGNPSSAYTKRIAEIVEKYKNYPRMKREYLDAMQSESITAMEMEEARQQALAEGHAEGLAKGLAEGHAKGLKEGERQNALETARKMMAENCERSLILKVTGITEEDLDSLS